MSVRNILVAFNGSETALSALKYAAALAGDIAHVTALLAYSTHETVDSRAAWVPAKARKIIAEANAEILTEIETRFDAARDALGLGSRLHFERAPGRVDMVLSQTARNYDLLVVGQDLSEEVDTHVILHPDRIALLSGRPVLIIPEGYEADAIRQHAVVAWDGGRAAARALSDGLSLLQGKGRVTVLTVGQTTETLPVPDVVRHLERHDVVATHEQIAADPGIARALLAYCREQAPSLLIMGAYEHSKFREDFLGGVTARVLRDTPVPVLLSH
ncbi:universal stress protein [Ruegeria sp. HKCCD8929]|uniref:universal stress protein n=1 Tax=Ruegeria sp. HKCCD8929 TaxID=2683006 RepID=UPI001489B5FE|nr:universal stress protein [Ruegeria sp. HKCCD8929]